MDKAKRPSSADYERLAAFRFTLRRFLSQADFNARNAGLTAQQYQALLSIRGGYPGRDEISIGDLAANLLLKNHSAVELVARLVAGGLVTRQRSAEDRRRICLRLTAKGERLLQSVAAENLRELRSTVESMQRVIASLEGA